MNQLTYRLFQISVPRFSYALEHVRDVEGIGIAFKTFLEMGFDISSSTIHVLLSVEGVSKKYQHPLVTIASDTVFEIKDFKDLINDGRLHISRDSVVTFASISFSTLRGILYQRLTGTPLQNLALPVINPNTLVPEDFPESIEIETNEPD